MSSKEQKTPEGVDTKEDLEEVNKIYQEMEKNK